MKRKALLWVLSFLIVFYSTSIFAMGGRRFRGGGGMGGGGMQNGGFNQGGMQGHPYQPAPPPQYQQGNGSGSTTPPPKPIDPKIDGHAPTVTSGQTGNTNRPIAEERESKPVSYKEARRQFKEDATHNPSHDLLISTHKDLAGRCVDSSNQWHSALLQTFVLDNDKKEIGFKVSTKEANSPKAMKYWQKKLRDGSDDLDTLLSERRKAALDSKSYLSRTLEDNVSEELGLEFKPAASGNKKEGTHYMKIWSNPSRKGSNDNKLVQLLVHTPKTEDSLGLVCTFDLNGVVEKKGRFLSSMDSAPSDKSSDSHKNKDNEESTKKREPRIRFITYGDLKNCVPCKKLNETINKEVKGQVQRDAKVSFEHVEVDLNSQSSIGSFDNIHPGQSVPYTDIYVGDDLVEGFSGAKDASFILNKITQLRMK